MQIIGLWVLFKTVQINCNRLSKQIELENPDLKEQINFIGRFERNDGVLEDLKEMMEQQCFSSLKSQKKRLLNFHKILQQLFNFDHV